MDNNNLIELMSAFSNSNIYSIELEQNDFKLKMEKKANVINLATNDLADNENIETTYKKQIDMSKDIIQKEIIESHNSDEEYKIIESPMVGTFYSASSPDSEAFVKLGAKVKQGQIVCIIEAMKLMNEIESDFDGEIVEILVKNEQMVEYGQPLFKLKCNYK